MNLVQDEPGLRSLRNLKRGIVAEQLALPGFLEVHVGHLAKRGPCERRLANLASTEDQYRGKPMGEDSKAIGRDAIITGGRL